MNIPVRRDCARPWISLDQQTKLLLSSQLVNNDEFKIQWNFIRTISKTDENYYDEDYYHEELDKLFNLVIKYFGFIGIPGFHGDNYTEFSNKFFDSIDFDNNNKNAIK